MSLANELTQLGMPFPLAKRVAAAIEDATATSVSFSSLTGVPANVTALAEAVAAPYSETESDLAGALVGVGLMEPSS